MARCCSSPHRDADGFTLVELIVTILTLAVVVTALCDVFIANQKAWSRQSGKSSALIATGAALTSVGSYARNATYTRIFTRFSSGDALVVCLPADRAYGFYIPMNEHNDDYEGEPWDYQPGQSVVFYLSDSTGSYARSGSILWAGTVPGSETPSAYNVTPDPSWSLYPGTTNGRIAPIASIRFETPPGQRYENVDITVRSSYKAGAGTATLTRTRSICLRNLLY